MAQPTLTDVHVDAILTQLSVAYIQRADAFVSTRVFPAIPVQKQRDIYYVYTKGDWFRDEAEVRADASESAGSGYGLSTAAYSCDVWAMHKDIGDQVRANSDAPLDPDRDATEFVTQRLMLRRERQWAADYFAASIWATDVTPGNLWDNYTTSDPIADVSTGKTTILSNTGYAPNTLLLGYTVYEKLRNHPDIIDRIKYSGGRTADESTLAQLFGIDRVLVARAVVNTANEGATASMSFVHGKHALLCYAAPSPSLLAPSAGYTFEWNGISGGMNMPVGVARIDVPLRRAVRIEAQIAFDNKVVATDLGYFFASVVA